MKSVSTNSYSIEGMTCASCDSTIEKVANKIRGIKKVTVNLAIEKLSVKITGEFYAVE